MIVLDTNWLLMSYRVAYFPNADLLSMMIGELRPNEILRVRQTTASLDEHPALLEKSVFNAICVDLTKEIDAIQKMMDPTSRRWLRKAEKLAAEVDIRTNDVSTHRDFVELYNRFARLNRHSGPITTRRLQRFAGVSDLFLLYYRGRPACGHLWLRDEVTRRVRLLFSASARLESKSEAALSGALNRYLHWYEIESYKEQKFELYDMGGFEVEEDLGHSLTRFKLSLGGFILRENNYCFGRGLARVVHRIYRGMPRLALELRGRLPA